MKSSLAFLELNTFFKFVVILVLTSLKKHLLLESTVKSTIFSKNYLSCNHYWKDLKLVNDKCYTWFSESKLAGENIFFCYLELIIPHHINLLDSYVYSRHEVSIITFNCLNDSVKRHNFCYFVLWIIIL